MPTDEQQEHIIYCCFEQTPNGARAQLAAALTVIFQSEKEDHEKLAELQKMFRPLLGWD